MKLRVLVTPKTGVLDPEGRAIQSALADLGYTDVADLRTGKIIELDLAISDPAAARLCLAQRRFAARRFPGTGGADAGSGRHSEDRLHARRG